MVTQAHTGPSGTASLILTKIIQPVTMGVMLLLALGFSLAVALAAFGVIAWPDLPLMWNGAPVEGAGMWAMIGLAAFFVARCAFLPMSHRVMSLESAHRDFRLSHEFDAVRERLAFLRDHPDLGRLEPDILEAAAQMSQMSRELADTYSEEKVERARTFLKQRQEEIEQFNDRLETAKAVTRDLRHWLEAVELDESVARSQLDRLRAELDDILPELNIGLNAAIRKETGSPGNVVGLGVKPAAE